MLRYACHHNYETKAVRKSHDKTKSNKRKSKKNNEIITPDTTNDVENNYSKASKHSKKYESNDEDISYFKKNVNNYVPKIWKDSWKRPLNQNISMDEYDSTNEKIRTDKTSKRQNNRKNTYIADMINYE